MRRRARHRKSFPARCRRRYHLDQLANRVRRSVGPRINNLPRSSSSAYQRDSASNNAASICSRSGGPPLASATEVATFASSGGNAFSVRLIPIRV